MRKLRSPLLWSAALIALLPTTLFGQKDFVYANDNKAPVNTVTAYSVSANGVLAQIPGSPFSTGGSGANGPVVTAAHRLVVVGDYLYAADEGSNDVAGFGINAATGALTPVQGSPFPTGGSSCADDGSSGISLAATPDGKLLFAGCRGLRTVTALTIGSGGVLTAVGAPVPADGIDGLAVSPDGRYLVVATGYQLVDVFSIGSGGSLTPASGSPFAVAPGEFPTDVDVSCADDRLYIATAGSLPSAVGVFAFPPSGGVLSQIPGSPFSLPSGYANTLLLSPDGSKLFAPDNPGQAVDVFAVGSDGSLTLVGGSPFTTGVGDIPIGAAINQPGTMLYLTGYDPGAVGSLFIGSTGVPTAAPGSPFSDTDAGRLTSVATFPPAGCLIPFSQFSGKLLILAATPTGPAGFQLNATFTLASGGRINPPTDSVTVVGPTSSFTIPGGSFTQLQNGSKAGSFVYSGTLNGAAIQAQIVPLGGDEYQLKEGVSGVDWTSVANPVTLEISIGGDTSLPQAIQASFN